MVHLEALAKRARRAARMGTAAKREPRRFGGGALHAARLGGLAQPRRHRGDRGGAARRDRRPRLAERRGVRRETAAAEKPRVSTTCRPHPVPLVGLTAWQALIDLAHLRASSRVALAGAGTATIFLRGVFVTTGGFIRPTAATSQAPFPQRPSGRSPALHVLDEGLEVGSANTIRPSRLPPRPGRLARSAPDWIRTLTVAGMTCSRRPLVRRSRARRRPVPRKVQPSPQPLVSPGGGTEARRGCRAGRRPAPPAHWGSVNLFLCVYSIARSNATFVRNVTCDSYRRRERPQPTRRGSISPASRSRSAPSTASSTSARSSRFATLLHRRDSRDFPAASPLRFPFHNRPIPRQNPSPTRSCTLQRSGPTGVRLSVERG